MIIQMSPDCFVTLWTLGNSSMFASMIGHCCQCCATSQAHQEPPSLAFLCRGWLDCPAHLSRWGPEEPRWMNDGLPVPKGDMFGEALCL